MKKSQNTFQVSDAYRTNALSLIPGGTTIQVIYQDGSVRVYDKIKNVQAYTRYLKRNADSDIREVVVL